MQTLTKTELVRMIAKNNDITIVKSEKIFKDLEEIVFNAMTEGKKVQLTGFVSIMPAYRSPRMGYNPTTQEAMPIDERVAITAKVGERLAKAAEGLDVEAFRPKQKEGK